MGEALLIVCHILNRTPMKKNEISTYELWKGMKHNIDYFKVWGCLVLEILICGRSYSC